MPQRSKLDFTRMKASLVEKKLPPGPQQGNLPTQSVRRLPLDLETDLRKACSLVVDSISPAATRSREPTGERRIRACTTVGPQPLVVQKNSPGLSNHPLNSTHQARHQIAHSDPDHPNAIRSVEDAQLNANGGSVVARVGEVITGVPVEEPGPTHVRSKSSSAYLSVTTPRFIRPSIAYRGSSMETTRSAYQSDVTDDGAISTAITSVGISPARLSKRTSARTEHDQEQPTVRPDSQDLEEMRKRLDAHRSTRAEESSGHGGLLRKLSMPSRKPVRPPKQTANSVEHLFHAHTTDPEAVKASAEYKAAKSNKSRQQSKDDERQGRSTVRARAASSARSLSRGLIELLRPSSQYANDSSKPWKAVRPFSSRGERARDSDWARRGWRASVDSLLPPVLVSTHSDKISSPRLPPRRFSQQVLGGLTRPVSSHGNRNAAFAPINARVRNNEQEAIDLNRQLPPLPKLDSWKDDEVEIVLPEFEPALGSLHDHAFPSKEQVDPHDLVIMDGTNLDDDCQVSPITWTPRVGRSALTASSPLPEMSATFCPGEVEFYEPMRTPSSISESSIRDWVHNHNNQVWLAQPDVESTSSDCEYGLIPPESTRIAQLVSRVSSGNLRAQLIDATAPYRAPVQLSALSATADEHENRSPPLLSSEDLSCDITSSEHDGRVFSDTLGYNHDPYARPVILLRKTTKKHWWRAVAKYKQRDWMKDVEQSGSHSGLLMLDEAAAAPIVRYS